MSDSRKIRVAWFSDLSIERSDCSVSAYFTQEVLPLMANHFEIDVFHDGFEAFRDYPTYHYLSCFQHHQKNPYDIFFYQVEDDLRSNFTRSHLALQPGVVLFHDLLFKSDGPEPLFNSPWQTVQEKFKDSSVEWPARDIFFEKQGPLGYREAGMCFVPVFSSSRNLEEFKRGVNKKLYSVSADCEPEAFYLPYPARVAEVQYKQINMMPVIAFCSGVEIEGRAHKVLQAIAELGFEVSLIWLLHENQAERAQALVKEFGLSNVEFDYGFSPANWRWIVDRADLAVHTLFSVYSDPGPYLSISLIKGLPCVVTNFASAETLPSEVVFKIEPGSSEAEQLKICFDQLISVLSVDSRARELASIARGFAREFYDSRLIAQELGKIFEMKSYYLKEMGQAWSALEQQAYSSLLGEVCSLPCALGDSFSSKQVWQQVLASTFQELNWSENRCLNS